MEISKGYKSDLSSPFAPCQLLNTPQHATAFRPRVYVLLKTLGETCQTPPNYHVYLYGA